MLGRVTVVGCGLIGGSLVKALRDRRAAKAIGAIDHEEVLLLARPYLDVAAPAGSPDATRLVAESDIVVFATPVASITREIPWALDAARPDAIVTDTGSLKMPMIDAAAQHPKGAQFVGGHPMAGREIGGFSASSPTLFEQTRWFITENEAARAGAIALITELARATGADPVVIGAEAHDRAMAYVSHVPQLVASALYGVAADAGALEAAGQGFRDTTRIAGGPAAIWRDILDGNRAGIAEALADLLDRLIPLREALAREREAGLSAALEVLERAQTVKSSREGNSP
jgi:prephenate dehydrogenase